MISLASKNRTKDSSRMIHNGVSKTIPLHFFTIMSKDNLKWGSIAYTMIYAYKTGIL